MELCSYCQTDTVVLAGHEYCCSMCGSVQDRFLDCKPEKWAFGDVPSDSASRVGLPINELLPDVGRGTMISWQGHCAKNMFTIQKYHHWQDMNHRERSLCSAFEQMAGIAANHGISSTTLEDAKHMYKQMSEHETCRGSHKARLIASAIYMACRASNGTRTIREVAAMFCLPEKTIMKACKRYYELLRVGRTQTGSNGGH